MGAADENDTGFGERARDKPTVLRPTKPTENVDRSHLAHRQHRSNEPIANLTRQPARVRTRTCNLRVAYEIEITLVIKATKGGKLDVTSSAISAPKCACFAMRFK